jgi:hypothetical protein
MDVRWLTAFLDTPRSEATDPIPFWAQLTGAELSAPHGERGEFATLQPPGGDAYLWAQRIEAGEPGTHLDLHVPDVRAAPAEAVAAGAEHLADHDDVIVLRSPAGLVFCLAEQQDERTRPAPLTWPNGASSQLDQICLDVPVAEFDAELAWWGRLTGWRPYADANSEFGRLDPPDSIALRLLVQRIDEGSAHMHLDFASSDRSLEVDRHRALGATLVVRRDGWTVLRDPVGREYCVTDRDPGTRTSSRL